MNVFRMGLAANIRRSTSHICGDIELRMPPAGRRMLVLRPSQRIPSFQRCGKNQGGVNAIGAPGGAHTPEGARHEKCVFT